MLQHSAKRPSAKVRTFSKLGEQAGHGQIEYDGKVATWEWNPAHEGQPDCGERLITNLEAMAALVRDAGIEPVIMTYPADVDVYGAMNGYVRRAMAQMDARAIDLSPVVKPLCATEKCPEYFFDDLHPRA